MVSEEVRARRRERRQLWRKNNPDKVKAQKRRYYERTYVKQERLQFNEVEQQRVKKRFDSALLADSYVRELIARRLKMKVDEVPQDWIELYRPLLQIKRECKDIKKEMNHWINVKDKLPLHNQFVLAIGKSGSMEVLRCDLHRNGEHLVDYVFMHPNLSHQVTGVTHWMLLPEPPNAE